MCQSQGQEKPMKKCSDVDKEQKISADATTHSPASNKANVKAQSEESEKKKETSKKEGTGTAIQQGVPTHSATEPNVHEKSTSLGTPDNPDSSDTSQIPADKPHAALTSSSPGGNEMSNTPHTPKTLEPKTASPEEG